MTPLRNSYTEEMLTPRGVGRGVELPHPLKVLAFSQQLCMFASPEGLQRQEFL